MCFVVTPISEDTRTALVFLSRLWGQSDSYSTKQEGETASSSTTTKSTTTTYYYYYYYNCYYCYYCY